MAFVEEVHGINIGALCQFDLFTKGFDVNGSGLSSRSSSPSKMLNKYLYQSLIESPFGGRSAVSV